MYGVGVELNRKAKGDLAELKVAADVRARGYRIAVPYDEDWDYDLILCRPDGRARAGSGEARAIERLCAHRMD